MQRFFLRSIANIVLLAITVSIVSKIVAGTAYLLLEAGSPILKDWVQVHSAWRCVALGVLAGLAPASLCFSAFLWFTPKDNPGKPKLSRYLASLQVDKIQPWTWLFFSPLFIAIMFGWIQLQSHRSSIFASSSPYTIGSFIEYWNSELSYMDPHSMLYAPDWDWMKQVIYIWILAASVGYSLAPSLHRLGLSVYERIYRQPTGAAPDEAEESTMNETIDRK